MQEILQKLTLSRLLFWLCLLAAGLAIIATLLNIQQGETVRRLNAEVTQRQLYINETARLNAVRQDLVNAMGQMAADDDTIRQLLADNNIPLAEVPQAAQPARSNNNRSR